MTFLRRSYAIENLKFINIIFHNKYESKFRFLLTYTAYFRYVNFIQLTRHHIKARSFVCKTFFHSMSSFTISLYLVYRVCIKIGMPCISLIQSRPICFVLLPSYIPYKSQTSQSFHNSTEYFNILSSCIFISILEKQQLSTDDEGKG